MKEYNCYTDASIRPNGKGYRAGGAFVLVDLTNDCIVLTEGRTYHLEHGDSIYAELKAIARALIVCNFKIEKDSVFRICSDCLVAINMITKESIIQSGKTRQLVKKIHKTIDKFPTRVQFQWVKSHSDHPMNDLVDSLAKTHSRH